MSMSVAISGVSWSNWIDVLLAIVIFVFAVRIFEDLITHVSELGIGRFRLGGTGTRPGLVFPHSSLRIDLCCPLFHFCFTREAYNEVFDAWVSFPEDLASI